MQSWSGGFKLADMPGSRENYIVRNKLSELMGEHEGAVHALARHCWAALKASPAMAEAAARMEAYVEASEAGRRTRIEGTGFNAYSMNIDYRTGRHVDGKNLPGSYSALAVFETGEPFCGGFYMLPQYSIGFDLRQVG